MKLGVITFPISKAGFSGIYPLESLINILYHLSGDIYLITGDFGFEYFKNNDKVNLFGINYESESNSFLRILKYISIQIKMAYRIICLARNVNYWIFSFGGQELLLPVLVAKLLNKTVILLVVDNTGKGEVNRDQFYRTLKFLNKITRSLSDRIVIDINVKSDSLIRKFELKNYEKKTSFGGAVPVDSSLFYVKKKLKNRNNLIGYFGRHSIEKGVLNFLNAIPFILAERNDLEFLIGGDGELFEEIENELKQSEFQDKVVLTGYVPRNEISDYFNSLKIMVVPSYTETIPNVILENMACGTPIVASAVDAIPDLIKDGENGFLMENNSPECISKNVLRALSDPNLDNIVKRAQEIIDQDYSQNAVNMNYKNLFERIKSSKGG